jgi:hypothetical protein
VRRGVAPPRTRRLWLPDTDQVIRPVEAAEEPSEEPSDVADEPALRSVG